MASPQFYKGTKNTGITRRECATCGQENAHLRVARGWQCMACKQILPPDEEGYKDEDLPIVIVPDEIIDGPIEIKNQAPGFDGTIVVII